VQNRYVYRSSRSAGGISADFIDPEVLAKSRGIQGSVSQDERVPASDDEGAPLAEEFDHASPQGRGDPRHQPVALAPASSGPLCPRCVRANVPTNPGPEVSES
jgi:hypothetical protein